MKAVHQIYFAYGSNMNLDQMAARCPSAQPLTEAWLDDWRLQFRGVADIEEHKGESVPGALWRITPDCLRSLDRYEGWPRFYGRYAVTARTPRGEQECFVYVINRKSGLGVPSDHYFAGIYRGYQQFGLAHEKLSEARQRSVDWKPEPRPKLHLVGGSRPVRAWSEYDAEPQQSSWDWTDAPQWEICLECGDEFDSREVPPGCPDSCCADCWIEAGWNY